MIGYAHGGITEMVKNGYNGQLVKPLDKLALQDAVKRCIENKSYINWGKNSRKRLVDNFSLAKFITTFEETYNEIQ